MRPPHLLLYALSLFLCSADTSLAQHGAVQVRQNDATPTSTDSTDTSASGSAAPTASTASNDAPPSSSSIAQMTSVTGARNATSSIPSTMQTSTISISTSSTPTTSPTPTVAPGVDSLPLQPVLSPGLGVAGILLMGFGIAYTLIGIRQKWLHIFCSVMYLVALAITVLLVYVVNPPVSPAVQGAYLVAAFVPGVIIGGTSLIFKEVVEGLGCLLGGFCFAMWLLCLAPGGLVHSSGGRIGLIIAFSAVCYMLSFSHYTRTYGLIGCISFAGATSIVLGIDCFSRAGLKEFWVYNWDLNMVIFPLGTSSYPTTRGIKVESAVIVIIAIFGVMSQVKLWNIIKDRRARREAAQRQDAEDREHLEADLGRRIETTNEREKAHWEKVYGSRGGASSPSMVGSTDTSTYIPGDNSLPPSIRDIHSSVGTREIASTASDAMEMHSMSHRVSGHSKHDSKDSQFVTVMQREIVDGNEAAKKHHRTNTLERLEAGIAEHAAKLPKTSSWEPTVEPLPFKVPALQADDDDAQSNHSLTTNCAGVEDYDDEIKTNQLNVPQLNRNSAARNNQRISSTVVHDEADVPHFDDRASSAAATLDGLTDDEDADLPKLSRPASPSKPDQVNVVPARRRSLSSMDGAKSATANSLRVPSDSKVENRKSMPLFADLEKVQQSMPDSLYTPSTDLAEKLDLKTKPTTVPESTRSTTSRRASLKKEFLPEDQPAVASIYRTNEWAKHQVQAETPPADEIAPQSEEGVVVDFRNEASVPVDMQGLQQTALTGHTSMARTPSQASTTNPYMNMQRSTSQLSVGRQSKSPKSSPPLARDSMPSVQRVSSQSRVNGMRSGVPSTGFMSQPLIESPTEDSGGVEQQQQQQYQQPYIQSNSSATLLGRREDLLTARKSQTLLPGSTSNTVSNAASSSTHSLVSSNSQRQKPTRHSSTPLLRTDNIYSSYDDLPAELPSRHSLLPSDSMSIRGAHSPTSPLHTVGGPIYEEPESASALGLAAGQDYDDIPLSQRKQLIRQSSLARVPAQTPTQLRRSDSHFSQSASPSSPHGAQQPAQLLYDAHLPQRGPSFSSATQQQQQTRLANWRSELSSDEKLSRTNSTLLAQAQAQDDAMRRIALERRQRAEAEQRREWERSQQQGMLDERMRSGGMLRTHAEVLRRMQARADAGV